MNFDINTVSNDMLAAIKGIVTKDMTKVGPVAKQFIAQNKEVLEMMAGLRISGELSDEDFRSRLEDQKLVLEAQLNALEVISKSIAQQAANAVLETLEKAVIAAVKI